MHLPSGDKTFSSFQKGRFTLVFLKPQTPFTTPIKPKLKTIGPLRSCKADSLRGIKHFEEKKVQYTFPKGIKHKLKTIGPLRSLQSRLPPGDKKFSSFQKGHFPIRKKSPIYVS